MVPFDNLNDPYPQRPISPTVSRIWAIEVMGHWGCGPLRLWTIEGVVRWGYGTFQWWQGETPEIMCWGKQPLGQTPIEDMVHFFGAHIKSRCRPWHYTLKLGKTGNMLQIILEESEEINHKHGYYGPFINQDWTICGWTITVDIFQFCLWSICKKKVQG